MTLDVSCSVDGLPQDRPGGLKSQAGDLQVLTSSQGQSRVRKDPKVLEAQAIAELETERVDCYPMFQEPKS